MAGRSARTRERCCWACRSGAVPLERGNETRTDLSSSLNLRRPATPATSTAMLPDPSLVMGTVI